MKIKLDKSINCEQEKPVQPEEMLEIEKESLHLAEVTNTTKAQMTELYTKMLDSDFDEKVIQNKYNSLKRTTANLTKSLSQTYVMGDELNARWNDICKQRKRYKLISGSPANATIEVLTHITERITHEVKGVNRVLYDLTPKPTGTIEWE